MIVKNHVQTVYWCQVVSARHIIMFCGIDAVDL